MTALSVSREAPCRAQSLPAIRPGIHRGKCQRGRPRPEAADLGVKVVKGKASGPLLFLLCPSASVHPRGPVFPLAASIYPGRVLCGSAKPRVLGLPWARLGEGLQLGCTPVSAGAPEGSMPGSFSGGAAKPRLGSSRLLGWQGRVSPWDLSGTRDLVTAALGASVSSSAE